MNNPKGMVRGDGGFTEGMLFVIFFDQGDATPPASPLNSSPAHTYIHTYTYIYILENEVHIFVKAFTVIIQ